jgi:aminoglycoside 6'-N-acetyltransferase I
MHPMNNTIDFTIEEISENHISKLTEMTVKLWPDCNYEEESDNCLKIMKSSNQKIFIAKSDDNYVGFVQLSIRTDYVEGTSSSPVVYIEGLYVEPNYRKQGVAIRLVKKAEIWGLEKNCTEIASDTELNNANSIEFHKSIGFKEVNRVVCFSKTIFLGIRPD